MKLAVAILLLSAGPALAQDDFKNRWFPNDEPVPTQVPQMKTMTVTTTKPNETTTTVTTTVPWGPCAAPCNPLPVPPSSPSAAVPPPVAPAPAAPPIVRPRATAPLPPVQLPRADTPPVAPRPRVYIVRVPRDDDYCCGINRLTDLTVPADRVNRGTRDCDGVGCY
jgi:hypothetical protein